MHRNIFNRVICNHHTNESWKVFFCLCYVIKKWSNTGIQYWYQFRYKLQVLQTLWNLVRFYVNFTWHIKVICFGLSCLKTYLSVIVGTIFFKHFWNSFILIFCPICSIKQIRYMQLCHCMSQDICLQRL